METTIDTQARLEIEKAKLNELREKLADIETDLEIARELPKTTTQKALVLLEGKSTDDELIFDLDKLESEAAVLTEAIRLQQLRVNDVQTAVGREIYELRRPEHDALVKEICDDLEKLHSAMQAENAFCSEIRLLGFSPRQIYFTSIPWLKKISAHDVAHFRQQQKSRKFNL